MTARSDRTLVRLSNGATFGGETLALCAGPCSVESEEQIDATAAAVARAGANVLRGGAFKPRTSPYAFQGLGRHGLALLRAAADRHGLAVVTEVLDPRDVEMVAEYADMLQIGARNMQNFALLREAGHGRQTGPAQARLRGDGRRVADGRRVRAGRGKSAGRVSANAAYARSIRQREICSISRSCRYLAELTHLPVDRRPVARDRPGAFGRANEPGSDRSGRRRAPG